MHATRRCAARFLAFNLLVAGNAAAQVTVDAGATLANRFVDQGVTVTNHRVLIPDFTLEMAGRLLTARAGFVAILETGPLNDSDALSMSGGAHHGFSYANVFAEAARTVGSIEITVGVDADRFSGRNLVLDRSWNTTEVYAQVGLASARVAPSLKAIWDVGAIHGLYFEATITHVREVARLGTITWGALAGFSMGQEKSDSGDAFYSYERRGLTHIDVWASLAVHALGAKLEPTVHFQLNPAGQNTAQVGALPEHFGAPSKLWLGARISPLMNEPRPENAAGTGKNPPPRGAEDQTTK